MSIDDWDAALLEPIYEVLGRPAIVRLPGGAEHTIEAIDAVEGVRVGENVEVPSVEPGCYVRKSDLDALGLTPEELLTAMIELNGVVWSVLNREPEPTPGGEREGELLIWLYREPEPEQPPTE